MRDRACGGVIAKSGSIFHGNARHNEYRNPRENGDPALSASWIPAFAGISNLSLD
jgi:hypothetical protein